MLFIIQVLAVVLASILPCVGACSVHIVIQPFSLISAPVSPTIDALARDLILHPVSFVVAAIRPVVFPLPLLLSHPVTSLISGVVRPLLGASSMLQVIVPLPVVDRSISMVIGAKAARFVLNPVAVENISIHMKEFALAVCHIVLPEALKPGAVAPNLDSVAISLIPHPFSFVDGPTLVFEGRPFFSLQGHDLRGLAIGLLRIKIFILLPLFFGLQDRGGPDILPYSVAPPIGLDFERRLILGAFRTMLG